MHALADESEEKPHPADGRSCAAVPPARRGRTAERGEGTGRPVPSVNQLVWMTVKSTLLSFTSPPLASEIAAQSWKFFEDAVPLSTFAHAE